MKTCLYTSVLLLGIVAISFADSNNLPAPFNVLNHGFVNNFIGLRPKIERVKNDTVVKQDDFPADKINTSEQLSGDFMDPFYRTNSIRNLNHAAFPVRPNTQFLDRLYTIGTNTRNAAGQNNYNPFMPTNRFNKLLLPGVRYLGIDQQYRPKESNGNIIPKYVLNQQRGLIDTNVAAGFIDPFYVWNTNSGSSSNGETGSLDPYYVSAGADASTSSLGGSQRNEISMTAFTKPNFNDPVIAKASAWASSTSNSDASVGLNDFQDPYYSSMSSTVSSPKIIYNQWKHYNTDDYTLDPYFEKYGRKDRLLNYLIPRRKKVESSVSAWIDNKTGGTRKGMVSAEWPYPGMKQSEQNTMCVEEDDDVPSVYLKMIGNDIPLCLHLNVPSNEKVTLLKHGEEKLDIKTQTCKTGKYNKEFVNAAYVPDHQLTMYPDLILDKLNFRNWKNDEVVDLPFPNKEMKIKAFRPPNSKNGIQIFVDVANTVTDYAGLLGPLANMKIEKTDTNTEGNGRTEAILQIQHNENKFTLKAQLRKGAGGITAQCWETYDTRFLKV